MPCVITYNNLEAAIWQRGEGIGRALQRLSRFQGPLVAEISLLEPVLSAPGASSVELSEMTHERMTAVWRSHQT
ncbi:MAG: hypothetical protein HC804_03370 [Anaerolineae bacterium]|nr:hypothetical protein [Anaerolineae bacterium]